MASSTKAATPASTTVSRPSRARALARPGPDRTDRSTESLVLNFFPSTFSSTSVTVWSGRWSDAETADALRAAHPGLVTWRDRDDASRMYIWNPTTHLTEIPNGFVEVTVALDESPQLFQRLVTDAVHARLRALGFEEKGHGWVNFEKPGLFAKVPSLAEAAGDAIGIYPKIVIDVFFTKNAVDELVMGLVVDVLYTTRMDVTAAEWVAAGLESHLPGKYVALVRGAPEVTRFPDLEGRVVGKIDGLRADGRCVLADLREPRLAEVALTSVAPEPTRQNLAAYLMARYEKAYEAGEQDLTRVLRELVRPKTRHHYARAAVLQRLQPLEGRHAAGLAVLPGITVHFGELEKAGPSTFAVRRLLDPEYSFDRAGSKFSWRVDTGLKAHGPYDSQMMRRETFRVLVIAPSENKGDVTLAIQKLLGGVPTKQGVFDGMRKMYRLETLQVTTAFASAAPGSAMTRYATAYHQALREAPAPPSGKPKFHLVVTVIHAAHRSLPDSENPYFQAKAQVLVTEGVPTQAITVEKLRQDDFNLQYIFNTMALACYAKLGGTSHVLKLAGADSEVPTELVFGIGRSMRRVSRFSEAEETIGFATVFRANGEYLFNDCTPYCDESSYERAMEDTIRRTVERVAAFEQLPDGSPLRLVFHVPRRPGRREEHAILNAVGKLPKYQVEFALVHVNDDHHLQIFDTANTKPVAGRGSHQREKPEAALLPARGLSVAIGPRERLITFIGVEQYRGNGCPTPLRITLDKRSTFTDVDYVTQQLFSLAFMNAGTLNPGVHPVTLTYAAKIANLTGHLRAVQNWTVELIQSKLGPKLWFV